MPFDHYRAADLKVGKTIPVVLDMLPGRPTAHLELLGDTNSSFMSDQIAKANTKAALGGIRKVTKKALADLLAKKREALAKHSVRKIDARHSDGRPATAEDIPEWVESLPPDLVHRLFEVATDEDRFRDIVASDDDIEAIAGK